MADYKVAAYYDGVIRNSDQKLILNDPNDPDWQAYQQWLKASPDNIPDAAVPPQPPPPEDLILFDHENRLRSQEGVPPIDIGEFNKMLGRK